MKQSSQSLPSSPYDPAGAFRRRSSVSGLIAAALVLRTFTPLGRHLL